MSEWLRTILASIVGGVIAFAGTWYATNRAAENTMQLEMRSKYEALIGFVTESDTCYDQIIWETEISADCRNNVALRHAEAIQIAFFPELDHAFGVFSAAHSRTISRLVFCGPSAFDKGKLQLEAEQIRDSYGLAPDDEFEKGKSDQQLTPDQQKLRKVGLEAVRISKMMDCRQKAIHEMKTPDQIADFMVAAREQESTLIGSQSAQRR